VVSGQNFSNRENNKIILGGTVGGGARMQFGGPHDNPIGTPVILRTAVPNSNTLKCYNYSQCRIPAG